MLLAFCYGSDNSLYPVSSRRSPQVRLRHTAPYRWSGSFRSRKSSVAALQFVISKEAKKANDRYCSARVVVRFEHVDLKASASRSFLQTTSNKQRECHRCESRGHHGKAKHNPEIMQKARKKNMLST
mmetsp:Transcript_13293/g.53037  ORF Transcript_13293/g.53037 Transcript_13293/m.53037 type:complete len:127 (+) Transcript_13293:204-584(+)